MVCPDNDLKKLKERRILRQKLNANLNFIKLHAKKYLDDYNANKLKVENTEKYIKTIEDAIDDHRILESKYSKQGGFWSTPDLSFKQEEMFANDPDATRGKWEPRHRMLKPGSTKFAGVQGNIAAPYLKEVKLALKQYKGEAKLNLTTAKALQVHEERIIGKIKKIYSFQERQMNMYTIGDPDYKGRFFNTGRIKVYSDYKPTDIEDIDTMQEEIDRDDLDTSPKKKPKQRYGYGGDKYRIPEPTRQGDIQRRVRLPLSRLDQTQSFARNKYTRPFALASKPIGQWLDVLERPMAAYEGGLTARGLVEGTPLEQYDKPIYSPYGYDIRPSHLAGATAGVRYPGPAIGASIGSHYYGDWLAEHTGLTDKQAQLAGAGIGLASTFNPYTAAATYSVPVIEGSWKLGTYIGEKTNPFDRKGNKENIFYQYPDREPEPIKRKPSDMTFGK